MSKIVNKRLTADENDVHNGESLKFWTYHATTAHHHHFDLSCNVSSTKAMGTGLYHRKQVGQFDLTAAVWLTLSTELEQ